MILPAVHRIPGKKLRLYPAHILLGTLFDTASASQSTNTLVGTASASQFTGTLFVTASASQSTGTLVGIASAYPLPTAALTHFRDSTCKRARASLATSAASTGCIACRCP